MVRRFALLVLFAAACFAARPVILTTDCGAETDDQWAVAHLAVTPEFDFRAIVTTHTGKHPELKPPAAENSARCARDVLAHMPGGSKPVVIPGSNVMLTSRAPYRNAGVDRIIAESKGFSRDRRLTVLIIGAATDTASALMVDPTLADRIEIVAMGFQSWDSGDEYNIQNDPIAWQVILDSSVPVTAGAGDVCRRDLLMTSERAHAALDKAGEGGRYLTGVFDKWLNANPGAAKSVTGNEKLWPIWDEITVAHLLGMTKSETRARPRLRSDLSFDRSRSNGKITWIMAVDGARLWTDLGKRISTAANVTSKQ